MIDLNELKKMAEAATPGPWDSNYEGGGDHVIDTADEEIAVCSGPSALSAGSRFELVAANSAFIAAANPTAILELIALASAVQDSAPAELPPLNIKPWKERMPKRAFTRHERECMLAEIADLRAALSAAPASPQPVAKMNAVVDAALSVLRAALDAAEVHPCDSNNDNARAKQLSPLMQNLYRSALAASTPTTLTGEKE